MKRFFAMAAALMILVFAGVMPAAARADSLYDAAGIFTDNEIHSLGNTLDGLCDEYGMDAAVVTVGSLGGYTAEEYADAFQEEYFGPSGVLLLISVSDRKYHITTNGDCISAFSDKTLDYMAKKIETDLREEDYYGAATIFADISGDVLEADSRGKVYKPPFTPSAEYVITVAGIALLVTAAFAWIAKKSMNDAVTPKNADMYMKSGAADITVSRDIYLYSTVTKHAKPKNNGGGSSTHTSSGGASHGGRGGSF